MKNQFINGVLARQPQTVYTQPKCIVENNDNKIKKEKHKERNDGANSTPFFGVRFQPQKRIGGGAVDTLDDPAKLICAGLGGCIIAVFWPGLFDTVLFIFHEIPLKVKLLNETKFQSNNHKS